jgi:hypothetical protein
MTDLAAPLPASVRISFFADTWDTHPTQAEVPWSAVLHGLVGPGSYTFRTDKTAGALFSPAEFGPDPNATPCKCATCAASTPAENARRVRKTKPAVRAVHFAVLDLDDVTPDQLMTACSKAEPFAACCYTTWSQPEAGARGLFRARLVLPLSRPVAPVEWPAVYDRLASYFGALNGTAECKNSNRSYYTPALPTGAEWAIQTWRATGSAALDPDALLRMPATTTHADASTGGAFVAADPVTMDQVRRFADRLSKRADPDQSRMGNLLRAALDGDAFAGPGNHDTALWAVANVLAEQFTHVDAGALADLFRPALSIMAQQSNHPDRPAATPANLAEKISRAQRSAHETRKAHAEQNTVERNRKITLAFLGKRSHPYTPDELAAFSGGDLSGPNGLADRWIVQRGNCAYVFFDGSYVGPFNVRGELSAACAQFLAPAISAGVELYEADSKGVIVPKSGESLIHQYGRVVERVEADLTAQRSYLAPDRHVFVEAPCPLAPLEPKYSSEVAEWLALLAGRAPGSTVGGKVDALLDWLAAVTMLDRPAPALYLKGEPGSGKSLLAFGLARLWSASSPTSMRAAMSKFNDAILRCPLVLADEKVPESWSGQPRTEELRELITCTEFGVERKYQSEAKARGSIRAILAANNMRLLSTKEDFTREDALALADRFLFVIPHPFAREWLIAKGGPNFGERLVRENYIAQHALWLRQQHETGARKIRPGGRLVVPGDAQELVRIIQTSGGAAWPALYWLWSFLQNPAAHIGASAGRPFAAVVKEGRLWVSFKRLYESWDHYLQGERPPTLERLTNAARGVVRPQKEARYEPSRARAAGVRYQQIDLDALGAWAQAQGENTEALHANAGGLLAQDTDIELPAGGAGRVALA